LDKDEYYSVSGVWADINPCQININFRHVKEPGIMYYNYSSINSH